MRQICTHIVRLVSALIGILMLSSCLDDLNLVVSPKPQENIEVGFYAGGAQTRTTMLDNGLSAAWTAGDELAVWAKNYSGLYTLNNQRFETYGIDGKYGFFTTTLSNPMPDGQYTYYCSYPVPLSVDGTMATFNIPAVQDGKVTGGADIMIATPTTHSALTTVPDPEDHSGLSLHMNRMVHQLRFYMPEEYTNLTEPINKIVFTMPSDVVGEVAADIAAPGSVLRMSEGSRTVTLNLTEPIYASSSFDEASFACAAICPSESESGPSDVMNITVYSKHYKAVLEPISLGGRQFLAGHSTPVRLMPQVCDEYYRLTMNIGDNHIGEPLSNVTIAFNGTPWYTYNNTSEEGNGNFTHSVESLNSDGREAYDLIVNSIREGKATYIYETEHALVNRPLTSDMMSCDGNNIVLELGEVPYLLYEDFSSSKQVAHDDDYSPGMSNDTNVKGYLLDDYMSQNGWNAARFSIIEEDFIRINCRYQSGAWVVGRYCGRLDTPALKYLKEGATVDVVVEFDEAFSIPTGSSVKDEAYKSARYKVGYHSKSESSAIDAVTSDKVNNNSSIVKTSGKYGNQDLANMTHDSVVIPDAGHSTRIVFYADTEYERKAIASNLVYYLYLDNIKVYIRK